MRRDEEYEAMLERDHRMLLWVLVMMSAAVFVQSVWG